MLLVSPSRAGFVAGHAAVTVSWVIVALVLLARGIRRPALRVAGLVLVAAAVGKLVPFDLVALDGLARVAAFLGAGCRCSRRGRVTRGWSPRPSRAPGRMPLRVSGRGSCGGPWARDGPGIEAPGIVLQQCDHFRAGQGPDVVERGVGAQRGADLVQRRRALPDHPGRTLLVAPAATPSKEKSLLVAVPGDPTRYGGTEVHPHRGELRIYAASIAGDGRL